MSAHRHQLSFNGLVMNRVYATGNTDTEGAANIDEAYAESDVRVEYFDPTRMSTQDMREIKQFQEGAEPNEIYEGIRTVHLAGRVYGSSYGDLEDRTQALHAALSPAAIRLASTAAIVGTYPDEPTGVLPLDFTLDTVASASGVGRRFYCRPNIGRPLVVGRKGDGYTRPWQAWMVAYDPRMYGQTLHVKALANLTGGHPSGNTVTNAGTAAVYPQVKVATGGAAGHDPTTLTNLLTGQALVLDLDPFGASGETFWLFPQRGEMTRGNGDGRYYYRKSGFLDNLFLLPGDNAWTWDDATNITSVTFHWRDGYA